MTDDMITETPWAELDRDQRTAALRRLSVLTYKDIGKLLRVTERSIVRHVHKYGPFEKRARRPAVQQTDKPETLTPFVPKTASYDDIRKAFLREKTPRGRAYKLADVHRAMGPNRKLTPPRHIALNRYQHEQMRRIRRGVPL